MVGNKKARDDVLGFQSSTLIWPSCSELNQNHARLFFFFGSFQRPSSDVRPFFSSFRWQGKFVFVKIVGASLFWFLFLLCIRYKNNISPPSLSASDLCALVVYIQTKTGKKLNGGKKKKEKKKYFVPSLCLQRLHLSRSLLASQNTEMLL